MSWNMSCIICAAAGVACPHDIVEIPAAPSKPVCKLCGGDKIIWDKFAGIGLSDTERNCPECTGNNDIVKPSTGESGFGQFG